MMLLTCKECGLKSSYDELRPDFIEKITINTPSINYKMTCPKCGGKKFTIPVDTESFKGVIGVTGK